jgi:hypothetical protein
MLEINTVSLPNCMNSEDIENILLSDATVQQVKSKNKKIYPGDIVGVRLNLNVLKNTGVAIQTIHHDDNKNKNFFSAEAVDYAEAVVLKM